MISKNQTKVASRRKFFSYMKQIATGAAVAGVSLGFLNPKDVFAASSPKSVNPQAIPCDGCQVNSCGFNMACWTASSYPTYYLMEYTITTGNVPHCSEYNYAICVTNCNYNPC
jgi:hypothetical protein